MSLTSKDSYFIFDGTHDKQIDGLAMGSSWGPTLADTILVYHKKNWLEPCPLEDRPYYYRRYVDDIYILFNSPEYLKRFQSYVKSRHISISFTIENEENNRMSFLDVNIICEQGKFTTSVYHKPTFGKVYTHFDSFLPSNKIVLIHTLLYRCFRICSDWTKFHLELVKLMDVFKSTGYQENDLWRIRSDYRVLVTICTSMYEWTFSFFFTSLKMTLSNDINLGILLENQEILHCSATLLTIYRYLAI